MKRHAGDATSLLSDQHPVAVARSSMDKRRLVLHFDINKTILMIDTVVGKSLSQVVNALLTDYFWGYVEDLPEPANKNRVGRWVCVSKQPTRTKPMLTGVEPGILMTYRWEPAKPTT